MSKKRNVLLIQVDGKFPNLALMKLSTYHKNLGDRVFLNHCSNPNIVYISCIFTKNAWRVSSIVNFYSAIFNVETVLIGGSGVSLSVSLPDYIEFLEPDLDLYGIDYMIGFSSRGCIRNCGFCIVPKKEGMIREHKPIESLCSRSKLVLLDNNFLASPLWEHKLQYIVDKGIKVNFNQGLDIRLINERNAELLSQVKYYDYHFKKRRLYFAWDNILDEKKVLKGIEILNNVGIPNHHLMFYVLIGYNSSFEEDYYRVKKLIDLGILPFIMPYNEHKSSLTRWINRGYYRFIPFKKYKKGGGNTR